MPKNKYNSLNEDEIIDEIRNFMKSKLEIYQVPGIIKIVSEIGSSKVGKIKR